MSQTDNPDLTSRDLYGTWTTVSVRYSDLDPGEGLPPGHAERVGGMSKAAREAAAQESVRPEGLRHLQLRPYNNDSG